MENKQILLYTISQSEEEFVLQRSVVAPNAVTLDPYFSFKSKTLDNCRNVLINMGLFCLGADPNDPPHVVENWI